MCLFPMIALNRTTVLKIALKLPTLLFFVENSLDVINQLIEGLFPTATCA